jgi:hypothetical protein
VARTGLDGFQGAQETIGTTRHGEARASPRP